METEFLYTPKLLEVIALNYNGLLSAWAEELHLTEVDAIEYKADFDTANSKLSAKDKRKLWFYMAEAGIKKPTKSRSSSMRDVFEKMAKILN